LHAKHSMVDHIYPYLIPTGVNLTNNQAAIDIQNHSLDNLDHLQTTIPELHCFCDIRSDFATDYSKF
jgi:hypothetical protein